VKIKELRESLLKETKQKIKAAVSDDQYISQSINAIMETDKVMNLLTKRLREWYGLHNPEFDIQDHEKYAEFIAKGKTKKTKDSMGADLKKEDLKAIERLAEEIHSLVTFRDQSKEYLTKIMQRYCPNILELAGPTIGAKLLEHTGSLKKMVMMPASTIQILGAEKALFRHLKTGARPPKFGLIHDHPFIQKAKRTEQGKRARALADKLSLAAKLDYFKGEFLAAKMKKELEKRFP